MTIKYTPGILNHPFNNNENDITNVRAEKKKNFTCDIKVANGTPHKDQVRFIES